MKLAMHTPWYLVVAIMLISPVWGLAQPTVVVDAVDPEASESGDPGLFRISRAEGDNTGALQVNFVRGLGDSSCLSNRDCAFDPSPVLFSTTEMGFIIPSGADSVDVAVNPLADNLVEGPEEVVLTIASSPSYVIGDPNSATVVIADNVTVVSVVASDPDASETGDPGTFRISRIGGNIVAQLQVNFTRGLGDTSCLSNNLDCSFDPAPVLFSATEMGFIIPSGADFVDVAVNPLPDNLVEGPENVVLAISADPNYDIGDADSATVVIADSATVVTVVATDPLASEEGDPGTFRISRTGGSTDALLRVEFLTTVGDSSCINTIDCAFDPPALVVSPTTMAFDIPAAQDFLDVLVSPVLEFAQEGDETIVLEAVATSNYTLGDPSSAVVTITDTELVFVDYFETELVLSKRCEAKIMAASEPGRFLDLGNSVVDTDTGKEWTNCPIGSWYERTGACLVDSLAAVMTDAERLILFNSGLLGDNLGFEDWRKPSRAESSYKHWKLRGCAVR